MNLFNFFKSKDFEEQFEKALEKEISNHKNKNENELYNEISDCYRMLLSLLNIGGFDSLRFPDREDPRKISVDGKEYDLELVFDNNTDAKELLFTIDCLLADLENDSVIKLRNEADMQDVEFREVEYSLAYLESVRLKITPFMSEYSIATVDADEMTNKIHIELYEENEEIESLVSEFIDWEDVTITVLPDDIEFRLT